MKQEKLLLLGGLRYLIPVIKAAHDLGLYVITCDYLPDNIAHKYSDEYHNVNITDKEAVLELAKQLDIDGIMSFAVDPGVLTASYVAEKLGLPGCPYNSVVILQNKALFRGFLAENNFNVPIAKGFSIETITDEELSVFTFPIIVKPVDSAGSKGVTKVEEREKLDSAIKTALANSLSGNYIIEEFIEKQGFSSDTDCFSVDSEMVFYSFSNQYFDNNAKNPYAPSAYSWPSSISDNNQEILKFELQRLIKLLNLGTSVYNIEVREGVDGKAYIMEVSPRGGGNRLSEMLKFSTGVDLITNAVKAAIGDTTLNVSQQPYKGYWAEIILHANKSGKFQKVEIKNEILHAKVIELDLWVLKGEQVKEFNAANDAIGTVILKFDAQMQLEKMVQDQDSWLKIIVDE